MSGEVEPPNLLKHKLRFCALALSPLVVALVVVGGLGILSVENLGGRVRPQGDHSQVILKLLFRN